jgi:hypothetical protein
MPTLIMRWNGTEWSIVPSPSPGPNINFVHAISAASANDVWVVGSYYAADGATRTLTMHWNGSQWSVIPSPNPAQSGNYLYSVTAISATDAWAVGNYRSSNDTFLTLTLHWDGSQWNIVPSPNGHPTDNFLNSVDASPTGSVWAVGHTGPIDKRSLTMRWNGSEWVVIPSPSVEPRDNFVYSVSAISDQEAWAAGYYYGMGPVVHTLTMRHTTQCATPTATLTAGPSATASAIPCAANFIDVPRDHTFYASIRCLACRGIVSGYSDGTFRSNNLITRSQLAKIVSNAANFTEPPGTQIFQDVPSTNPFYEWINRLANRGYMSGYSCGNPGEPCVNNRPYFRPFNNATRAQTSKIVANAALYNDPPTGQTFEDVPPTYPFYTEIQRLASRDIMGGYNCGGAGEPCGPGNKPYFRPYNDVTRGQSAKIVANTFYPTCSVP